MKTKRMQLAVLGAVLAFAATAMLGSRETEVRAAAKMAENEAAQWSKVMPKEHLEGCLKLYQEDLGKMTKASSMFNRSYRKVAVAAQNVAVLGNIAVITSDKEEEKKKAAALRDAALELRDAAKKKTYSKAQAAVKKILAYPKSIEPAAAGTATEWKATAELEVLMKGVATLDTESREAAKNGENIGDMAHKAYMLAALQLAASDFEAKDDWKGWCKTACGDALAMAEKFGSKDQKGAYAAYSKMQKACTDCHTVYRKEE